MATATRCGNAHPYARRVAALLERDGHVDVRLEDRVPKRLWRRAGRAYIPFDISYLAVAPRPHREYIECKERGGVVSEQDVAKFLADLRTCGIDSRYGMLVTNGSYAPLARDYARYEGLRLYQVNPERSWLHLPRPAAVIHHVVRAVRGTPLPREFEPI